MADNLKDDLLPLIDELRGVAGELGFRPFQVWSRVVKWGGPRPGLGVPVITDTRLLVGGGQDPKVHEYQRKDAVAGAPEKVVVDYLIGPLTPAYAGGGVDYESLNPERDQATELFFILKGGDLPEEGLLCVREGDVIGKPLRRLVRVRSTGRKANPPPV